MFSIAFVKYLSQEKSKTLYLWHWLKQKFMPVMKCCTQSFVCEISTCFEKRCFPKYRFFSFKMSAWAEKNWHSVLLRFSKFQPMRKKLNNVNLEFWSQNLFDIILCLQYSHMHSKTSRHHRCVYVIILMQTFLLANQSERTDVSKFETKKLLLPLSVFFH